MMEPSNLDLHQQLQELHGSSPLAASYFHLVGGSHEWSQNLLLNGDNITQDINGLVSSSRDFIQSHETPLPPLSTPMVQDLGFHWGGKAEAYMSHSTNQTTLAQIKEELSDSSTIEDYHMPSTSCIKPQQQGFHELDEKLLTTTFSSGCQMNSLQPPVTAGDLLFHATSLGTYGEAPPCGRGNFSMVLPSTNISSLSQQPLSFPSSLGMDLQALDLIAAARFGKKISQPSLTSIPLLRKGLPYGLGCLQGLSQGLSNSHIKMPSLMNGVTETKRSNSLLEHKASQAVPKKQRLESHSSFSPFKVKVRKEKLGDRIAALQQLVAPFGKTDTASVLLEAIGYIKFLQDQVETLSVPYMGASSSKKLKATKEATSEETDEPKLDLRSKGLCLVPLSCTSYVTNESGGIWSSPNFRAGT